MFKFSVLSTEKAAGENVLPLRELPCLCLMICINIIKKAAREVLAAIFMIFYLTERKFVILFLDRVTGYEPVGRGFESLLAHQSFLILTKENPQCIKSVDFPQQVSLSILAEHI